MNQFLDFCKREIILIVSALLALISCLFVPVCDYLLYVDTDIISILFCLMIVIAGFAENGIFNRCSQIFVNKCGSTRSVAFTLVVLTFFASVFITNDVALITFVPFTILTLSKNKKSIAYIIILQTIAANLGSCLSPMGNPQNLFIYSKYKLFLSDFLKITFPLFAISFLVIMLVCLFVKNEKIEDVDAEPVKIKNKVYNILYGVLFVLCLLGVLGLLNIMVLLSSVLIVVAISQPVLFKKVDYGLLFTFAFLFIFVGNIQNIDEVKDILTEFVEGKEYFASIILSQIISNVPATIMISGFSSDYRSILLGVNVGGLGTLIASMASVISFKQYCRIKESDSGKYILFFTGLNLVMLAVLVPVMYLFV